MMPFIAVMIVAVMIVCDDRISNRRVTGPTNPTIQPKGAMCVGLVRQFGCSGRADELT